MDTWIKHFKNNDFIAIKKMIKNGEDMSVENESEESLLCCALREKCDDEIIMLLIENGADTEAMDCEGVSVFDTAITYNNMPLIKYMLAQGHNLNKTFRRSGFTALMGAVCYSRTEMVKLFIAEGVDTNAQDTKGFKAYDFARKMHKKVMMELLEEK